MGAKLNIPSNIETYHSKQSRRRSRRKQARRNRRRQQRLSGSLKNKLVPNLHPDNAASQELSDFSDCDFSDYDLKTSKMHRNSPSSNNRTPSEGSEPTKRKNRHQSSDNETDYESDSSASSEPDNEENVSESKTTLPKNVTSSKGNDSSSKTDLNSSDKEIENANSEPNAPYGKKIKRIVESQPESNRTERSALKNEKKSLKEKGPSRLIDRQHSSDSEIAKNISDSNMSSESVRKSSQSRRSDSSDLASEQDEEMLNRSKANIENTRNREGESGGGHESNLKSEEPKTNSSEIEFTKRFPREAVCNTSYKRNRKLSSPEHPAYNFGERLTSDSSPTEERRNMKRRRVKPSRSLSSRESPSPTIQRSVTERMFSKAQNVPSNHINTVCSAPRLPQKDSHAKPVSRDFDDGAQSPLDYDYIPNDTMYSQRIDNSNSESERFYRLVNSAGDDRDGKQAGRRTESPSRSRYLSIQWAQGPLKSCNQDFEFSEGSVPRSPTKRSRDSTYDSRMNENENRVRQPPDFLLAADDHIVDWDNPTYFDGENSHGVLCNIEPDIAYQKAAAWSNSLRKIMVQAPISILKKKSQIESSVKNAARQVRTFDAISTTSAMILSRSTVHIIKNFICSNFWEGEPCDKSCGKKHKINCDEFPSVSTDEVFQAVSDRLMEMEHPSIEMTNSFLEWLSDHHENIKMLSFSKILFTNNKGFNSLTKICELLVKYLARSYNCENYRMVEFLLKFHYVMVKKNPELAKTVVNKLIGYSQVGTYRHKVYEIVRFLLDVDGFSLQFKILDKLLYEVIANPPPDILILKEKIKRQLKSYEKAEDPDFRARAYRFLLTYFPETTRPPPINQ
ncbi:hypothetical protein GE061_013596 [Apolygus lucorum]|uniref:Uncharacterized protein n=1 Tax=Apolygus lucorum TaxID=248454 RepID=A0A8S9XN82_APOLU|nr:hypothetical protein GE061_013596 [Apolygus lucorum]